MRITSLELNNFSKHTKLNINPTGRVVGVLGGNGAGKTSVLTSLEFSLTGQVQDNLDSYVQLGHTGGTVQATFEHQGQRYTINRSFGKTSRRWLETPDRKLTAAKDVDEAMARILDVDKKTLSNAVFVKQGELQNLLFGTYTERRAQLIRLTNLSYLATRAVMVDKERNKLLETIVDLAPLQEQIDRDLKAAEQTFSDANTALESYPDVSVQLQAARQEQINQMQRSEFDQQLVHIRLQLKQKNLTLVTEQTRVGMPLPLLHKKLELGLKEQRDHAAKVQRYYEVLLNRHNRDQGQQALSTASHQADALQEAFLGCIKPAETLETVDQELKMVQEHLAALQARQAVVLRWNQFAARRDVMKAQLAGLVAPDMPLETVRQRQQTLHEDGPILEWQDKQLQVAEEITKCLKPGETRCVKCGLELKDTQTLTPEEIVRARADLESRQKVRKAEIAKLDQLLIDWYNYDGTKKQHTATLQEIERQFALVQTELNNCPPPAPNALAGALLPDKINELSVRQKEGRRAYTTWQGAIRNVKTQLDLLTQLTAKLTGIENLDTYTNEGYRALQNVGVELQQQQQKTQADITLLENMLTDIAGTDRQLTMVEQRAAKIPPSTLSLEEMAELPAMISKLEVTQRARDLAHGAYLQAQHSVNEQIQKQEDLKVRQDAQKRRQALVDDLMRMLTLLDEGGLPQMFLQKQFQQLQALTHKHLENLGANFVLAAPDLPGLEMRFFRPGEAAGSLPMHKLSGGQKIRLGLSFLLAVQQLLVPQLELLVLDEPSTHLDEEGVDALANLLRQLGGGAGNLQIWLADHHPLLKTGLSDVCLLPD